MANIARAALAGLLSILFLYNFFRAGAQVIGGLDPNFTANAWGGPSYLGALLAHYLDAAYLIYVEALLLNVVLVNCGRRGNLPIRKVVEAGLSGSRPHDARFVGQDHCLHPVTKPELH